MDQIQLYNYGELAPFFSVQTDANPSFAFESLGGQWIVLMFFGSLSLPQGQTALEAVRARPGLFDDENALAFGVSADARDRDEKGLKDEPPGLRFFWDFDTKVAQLYGVVGQAGYTPTAYLIDRSLRLTAAVPIDRIGALLDMLETHRAQEAPALAARTAPVLTVDKVLEPAFCAELIDHFGRHEPARGHFVMRGADGGTVGVVDERIKRRNEVYIDEQELRGQVRMRLERRLLPMIDRAFGWRATHVERYLIACYEGADRGLFLPHRDNRTAATAHRKFAVTINLNDDFEGGELRFPEFGPRLYRPPLGGATVFGCSLLHEATPVTAGRRFAFLPFLYDQEGAQILAAGQDQPQGRWSYR